jgi:multisubunit Na+/H+ antiporter MnhG subunit
VNAAGWAIVVLLGASVLSCWIGAAGLVAGRTALDKLHFTSLVGSLGIPVGCVAIIIQHGASDVAVKAVLIAVFSILTNAVLTHATGRAVRVAQKGDWRVGAADDVPELSDD